MTETKLVEQTKAKLAKVSSPKEIQLVLRECYIAARTVIGYDCDITMWFKKNFENEYRLVKEWYDEYKRSISQA